MNFSPSKGHRVNSLGQTLLKPVSNAVEALILTIWIVLTGILVWCLKIIKPPLALLISGLGLAAIIKNASVMRLIE